MVWATLTLLGPTQETSLCCFVRLLSPFKRRMRVLSYVSGGLSTSRSTAVISPLEWTCGRRSAWTAWWWSTSYAVATTIQLWSSHGKVELRYRFHTPHSLYIVPLHNTSFELIFTSFTSFDFGCNVMKSHHFTLDMLQDLVNIEMFLTAKEVEESLERQETGTCLAWCHDNKSRLRKMKVCPICQPNCDIFFWHYELLLRYFAIRWFIIKVTSFWDYRKGWLLFIFSSKLAFVERLEIYYLF